MTCKKFTNEFSKAAVQLTLNSDLSNKQVADDLGGGLATDFIYFLRYGA